MKPTATPYDRNSRLGLKLLTVNPCNQFIVQTLIRWKINVQKQGLNQFYTYNLAIQSVRKFPMPIICYEQMKTMEGFGKFFCTSVTKLIRTHYKRGRLPTKEQKQALDKQHEQFLRHQMKKMKKSMRKGNTGQEQQDENMQNESEYSQFNDNFQSQFQEGEEDDQNNEQDQSQNSEYSNVSAKSNRSYKPKPGCEVYHVIKAIGGIYKQRVKDPAYAANPKPFSRPEINTQLYKWKMDKIRHWNKTIEKLKQTGYIKIDAKDDDFVTLTTKGKDYLAELDQQTNKASNGNAINIIKIFRKQQLTTAENVEKLYMLVNTRGSFKSQDSFVNYLTQQRYKIKQLQFELGSFIFMIDTKILDYLIIRIKMENFDQQQFNTNLLRAKNSECSNIYFILEYPEDKNKKISIEEQQIHELVAKCRASNFRILRFNGQKYSIKFIHSFIDKVISKIKQIKNQQMFLLGTLDFYNQKNKKNLPIILKQVSKNFLKCIPRINRDSIQCLNQKFPTLKILYDQLIRLADQQQRSQFIKWLLKKFSPKNGISMLVVDLLFSETYQLNQETEG